MHTPPHLRSFRRTAALILAGSIAALLASHSAQAASQTWDGTPLVDANWSTGSNWSGGAAPGSTSLTNSTDVAIFNAAIANTWGNAVGNPIVIDSTTQNIIGISFNAAAGNYFLGSTGGNALKLSNGGTIQILNTLTATNAVETINAPLALQNTAYTFTNNSANGSGAGAGTLNFGGGITGAVNTGTTILNLTGNNTNANTISGIIGNGAAPTFGITKSGLGSGTGTWVLTGANTFTGNVAIVDGTIGINSIANTGVAQPLGQSAGNILLGNTGSTGAAKLQFTGSSGGSSNRGFTLGVFGLNTGGGAIENTVAGQILTLSGNVTAVSTVGKNVSLGLTGAGDGVMSGIISNTTARVSLTKTGTGTWTASGVNTYGGDTTVSGGTMKIGNTNALGFGGVQTTSMGTTTVNSGFTLDLNGTTGINEPITLNGTGIGGNGALVNNSGTPASIANGIAGLAVPATGIGTGLSSAPSVVISGTGSGATATASLGLTTASITSVSGGTGWVTGDTVILSGGGGSGAIGTVTASGGAITAVTITTAGKNFTSAPTGIQRLTGSGAGTVTLTGNATNFTVGGLAMTNAGRVTREPRPSRSAAPRHHW